MGKIFYLMGKSSSGKDSIYIKLMEITDLKTVVLYTTRPMRSGEKNGEAYHFTDEEGFQKISEEGNLIEMRAYDTVHGIWRYFTVDDGQVDLEKEDYLMIGTLESFLKMKEYYGEKTVLPIYVEVDDGERLKRALEREQGQKEPKYAELCRRFLADIEDFSEEKLEKCGITRRFSNHDLQACTLEILNYMKSHTISFNSSVI